VCIGDDGKVCVYQIQNTHKSKHVDCIVPSIDVVGRNFTTAVVDLEELHNAL
jgi:hypothetical protein